MESRFVVKDLNKTLSARKSPTLVGWNRLEGRPRTHDISQAIKADIRDPLWMLTRQYQVGEFIGEDAGSPIAAAYIHDEARVNRFEASGRSIPLNDEIPLEAIAEARPLVFEQAREPVGYAIRLRMGAYWSKLIANLPGAKDAFLAAYPVKVPNET